MRFFFVLAAAAVTFPTAAIAYDYGESVGDWRTWTKTDPFTENTACGVHTQEKDGQNREWGVFFSSDGYLVDDNGKRVEGDYIILQIDGIFGPVISGAKFLIDGEAYNFSDRDEFVSALRDGEQLTFRAGNSVTVYTATLSLDGLDAVWDQATELCSDT